MGKYIRVFIAIISVLSLVILAKSPAAWAANPAAGADRSSLEQAEQSVSPDRDDDCDKENNKNKDKDKCCGKDKDKKKCVDDGGTVTPPDDDIEVCERGNYSVGGVATLDVRNVKDRGQKDDCFNAHSESSGGLSGLPKNAGPVLSDLVVLESLGQGSNVKICFAALPGKQVKIYFTGQNSWKPVGTQVKNGIACAHVPASGSYVLARK